MLKLAWDWWWKGFTAHTFQFTRDAANADLLSEQWNLFKLLLNQEHLLNWVSLKILFEVPLSVKCGMETQAMLIKRAKVFLPRLLIFFARTTFRRGFLSAIVCSTIKWRWFTIEWAKLIDSDSRQYNFADVIIITYRIFTIYLFMAKR